MKIHNLDRLFLIPFRGVSLLDYLISCLEHPYHRAVTKHGGDKNFYCHFPFMNTHQIWNSS